MVSRAAQVLSNYSTAQIKEELAKRGVVSNVYGELVDLNQYSTRQILNEIDRRKKGLASEQVRLEKPSNHTVENIVTPGLKPYVVKGVDVNQYSAGEIMAEIAKREKAPRNGTLHTNGHVSRERRSMDEEQLNKTWEEFRKTNSRELRDVLFHKYLPLASLLGAKMYLKLGKYFSSDELVSYAHEGLVSAILHYDPAKHVKFSLYAPKRIHGHIFDCIRKTSWTPRLVNERSKRASKATNDFFAKNGRNPTEEEIAAALGLTAAELEEKHSDYFASKINSREREANENGRAGYFLDESSKRQEGMLQDIAQRDLKEYLSRNMSPSERMVLTLYYYEDLSMKEIGRVLDLSESRVSQIHSGLLERLRSRRDIKALLTPVR